MHRGYYSIYTVWQQQPSFSKVANCASPSSIPLISGLSKMTQEHEVMPLTLVKYSSFSWLRPFITSLPAATIEQLQQEKHLHFTQNLNSMYFHKE